MLKVYDNVHMKMFMKLAIISRQTSNYLRK